MCVDARARKPAYHPVHIDHADLIVPYYEGVRTPFF